MVCVKEVKMFGGTVRGPRHKKEERENQDSWLKTCAPFGHLIVVCDGLGSRPASSIGARAACAAVRRAVGLWPGCASTADPSHLVRLIEIIWRLLLTPRNPEDCATTCMFALRERGGHLILAGIGDGMAILRKQDDAIATYGGRGDADFGNETAALGAPHRIDDWWIATESPSSGRAVVLASDGVSDDLDTARLGDFVEWLVNDVGQFPATARWRVLRRELSNWPVPHHLDDKTVAVLAEAEGVTV
jgi:serine/threonine protein phosphatase PrpC